MPYCLAQVACVMPLARLELAGAHPVVTIERTQGVQPRRLDDELGVGERDFHHVSVEVAEGAGHQTRVGGFDGWAGCHGRDQPRVLDLQLRERQLDHRTEFDAVARHPARE